MNPASTNRSSVKTLNGVGPQIQQNVTLQFDFKSKSLFAISLDTLPVSPDHDSSGSDKMCVNCILSSFFVICSNF